MHIWTLPDWEKYYGQPNNHRTGLRLRFDKDVDSEVRRACKEFAKYLRSEYCFPKRIPVYIKATKQIKAMDGEMVSATFFQPDNRNDEPYIRVSAGDYYDLLQELDKDTALAAILRSITHELTHYFQWINDIELTEIGMERQARYYAKMIVYDYADTREHP